MFKCVCSADLILELYGECVRVVDRWVVRLKGDGDVLTLSWSDAAPCWRCTEHTQSTVVLCSCQGFNSVVISMLTTITSIITTAVKQSEAPVSILLF